jgi:hypothetical protein
MSTAKLKNLPAEGRAEIADDILEKYRAGQEIKALAAAYGLSHTSVYELLLRTREEDYRAAQTARSLARLETARSDLEKAIDPIAINRAEKLVKTYQWELEKLARRLYGQSEQESPNLIQINIGIDRTNSVAVDLDSQTS